MVAWDMLMLCGSLSLSHAARSLIFMYTTSAYAARFLISVSRCALSYLHLTLRAFLSTCIQLLLTLRVSLSLSHAARLSIYMYTTLMSRVIIRYN